MTPVVITGILLLEPFLVLWVGKDFAAESAGVGELILLGIWMNAIAVPQHFRFLAAEQPKRLAINYLVELAVYVLALWICIGAWGITGAACAYALRATLDALLVLRLNGTLRQIASASAASLLLVLAALGLRVAALPLIAELIAGSSLLALSLCLHKQTYGAIYRHFVRPSGHADARVPSNVGSTLKSQDV
jgi:O-antigen/teichoic acid export membrane protein